MIQSLRKHNPRQTLIAALSETQVEENKPSQRSTFQFGSGMRQEQLELISAESNTISDAEHTLNRQIAFSATTLGLTVVGATIAPIFTVLSVPALIYLHIPLFEEVYQDVVKERRLTMATTDVIFHLGAAATGQIATVALMFTVIAATKKLIMMAEDKSNRQILDIFGNVPRTARVIRNGDEVETPIESLQVGDVVIVQTGEVIPMDGKVCAGQATIDQRMLTGESQPVEKEAGDYAFASTIMLSGKLHIEVEQAGQDTVSAQIVQVLNDTATYKNDLQWQWLEYLDSTSPYVLAAGAIALPFLSLAGAVNVMCAAGFAYSMRIIAPLTLLNYLNAASFNGILIKDGRVLELFSTIDTVVFDKTGTLTEEQPHIGQVHLFSAEITENQLLQLVATAEGMQTHPIARAIVEEATQRGLDLLPLDDSAYELGFGIKATIDGQLILVGSARYMSLEQITLPTQLTTVQKNTQVTGHSLICVAINGVLMGAIELQPTIRPEAQRMVEILHEREIDTYIISGDHTIPTQRLANELGIKSFFAETLPENKATLIEGLQAKGKKVCFVGDGINDAIALSQADLSVSMRGASTIATDTAHVVLMNGNLERLINLFEISEQYEQTMTRSFRISMGPNAVAIVASFVTSAGLLPMVLLFYSGIAMGAGNSIYASSKLLPEQKGTENTQKFLSQ